MARLSPRRCFLLALAHVSISACLASVETRELDYEFVEQPGGDARWLQIEVEIEYRRDAADTQRFLDRVDVRLDLAFEADRHGGPAFSFYSSVARLVALEEGRTLARFYLPPEIVKRDRIRGAPHSYVVTVLRDGRELSVARSRSLDTSSAQASFLRRVAEDRPRSRGLLLPQNLTPFYVLYPSSTPSFRAPYEALSP